MLPRHRQTQDQRPCHPQRPDAQIRGHRELCRRIRHEAPLVLRPPGEDSGPREALHDLQGWDAAAAAGAGSVQDHMRHGVHHPDQQHAAAEAEAPAAAAAHVAALKRRVAQARRRHARPEKHVHRMLDGLLGAARCDLGHDPLLVLHVRGLRVAQRACELGGQLLRLALQLAVGRPVGRAGREDRAGARREHDPREGWDQHEQRDLEHGPRQRQPRVEAGVDAAQQRREVVKPDRPGEPVEENHR
mmetsp:Transcript_39844/g.120345  ORF Transcript_39844/g.120345 Transcript_39844/m.120345 type:complete len:245 (-) Transcript_39844:111-845(-)